jgi:hypothetical protein
MTRRGLREFPGRVEADVLREESLNDAKTLLIGIPAEGKISLHSHQGIIVQHYNTFKNKVDCQYYKNVRLSGP